MQYVKIYYSGKFGLFLEAVVYRKFINAMYAFNIILQAFFSLVAPAALGLLVAWLLVSRVGAPRFLYAIFIIVGLIAGFISMIRFVISAMSGIERLEAEWQRDEFKRRRNEKNAKREENCDDAEKTE